MANGQAELFRQVHQLFSTGRVGGLTDAELLGRFVSQRDEPAFAALVTRHGSMVLRVCQGVLQDKHAAEDAFQATFLVLAHKAYHLHVGETLSHWLHGVALRVAKKAKSQNARRDQRERTSASTTAWEPGVDPDQSETDALLHEEVDRLPESYRSPVVLCYLQGLSYTAAANQLGISEGTVRGRLARARDRLRIRLTRRGVVVPAGFLIGENAWTSASAAVPNSLIQLAVQGGLQTAVGKGAVAGAVSTSVVVLTKGVLRTMFLTQFKIATTVLLLTAGGLLVSKPFLINPHANAAPPASKNATPDADLAAPAPQPANDDDGGGANNEPTLDVKTNPRPWETVVRIKVQGSGSIGFGSGTVIQSVPEASLILTCAHIFKLNNNPNDPPERAPHKITVDLFNGESHKPSQVQTVTAVVVDYDLGRDVALLRIRPNRTLAVSPIIPPSWEPQKGMRMITAGCSDGNTPTCWTTDIINSKIKLFNDSPYTATECRFAPKQGRNGGSLSTLDGFVAGVSNYAEPRGNRGYYATSESIYHLLARNNLAYLYIDDELPTKGARKPTPETNQPSSAPVLSEVELSSLIQSAESQLRNGDHQGARATTDRLNDQILSQQEALRLKLEHLDGLARRSSELRRAVGKNEEPDFGRSSSQRKPINSSQSVLRSRPTDSPVEPDVTPPPPDHERRLRDIEQKLERLLEEKTGTSQ
ncbi:sigma-70 family RNA polymerase sigma factor [Singulisphaera acidiphila]|uniref:RNA polymerase sigma factor, sigma-70 family n=1 Tax=Singulisphaera acidiphila (strain ATCC BAA-1392 / DSM 18658 / VKM B-2454 / MOB10) TaxID=886293 RepID=L0DHG5_SINAD|nr:sigma-70 family RNA polymerase sigma factor [Singulisphaera acidiphila]AGA28116.1 RNA polymerase sigma factor, sigma-70 family [Singulisphaera acidiphila DSM 18658]